MKMLKLMQLMPVICVLTCITACGKPATEREGKDLLEGQRQLMKKAESVEDEMEKARQERMQAVDQQ